MKYRQIDVNLLPPELMPGPVVRYSLVINTLIITLTVAFILVNSSMSLFKISILRNTVDIKKTMIQQKSNVVALHKDLSEIQSHVDSVGRLISLASADYVEMPLIMARISRLLPDGVYLDSLATNRKSIGSTTTTLQASLFTSSEDITLVENTLNILKADPVFENCLLDSAEFDEGKLTDLLAQSGINWVFSGPEVEDYSTVKRYGFRVLFTIRTPIEAGDSTVLLDKSAIYTAFSTDTAPAGANRAASNVIGAPPGVTAKEVQ